MDGRTLTLTNLAKVLYPETGFTKAEVLDYYQRIAPVLLPHIAGRPLTLKRYPEGVDGEAFFQKNVTAHRPDWIRTADPVGKLRAAAAAPSTYLVVDDLPALIWAANLAGLELHVPQWRMPGESAGPTCWSSTWIPAPRPTSSTAAGSRRTCARCSRPKASRRWPRPRAARACSCTRRSPA